MLKFLMQLFMRNTNKVIVEDTVTKEKEPVKIGDVYSSESEWVNPNKNGIHLQERYTIINITKDGNKILCLYDIYDGKISRIEVEHDLSRLKFSKKESKR